MFEKMSAYLGYKVSGTEARKFYEDFQITVNEKGEVYLHVPNSEPVCMAVKHDVEDAFVEAERLGEKYSEKSFLF